VRPDKDPGLGQPRATAQTFPSPATGTVAGGPCLGQGQPRHYRRLGTGLRHHPRPPTLRMTARPWPRPGGPQPSPRALRAAFFFFFCGCFLSLGGGAFFLFFCGGGFFGGVFSGFFWGGLKVFFFFCPPAPAAPGNRQPATSAPPHARPAHSFPPGRNPSAAEPGAPRSGGTYGTSPGRAVDLGNTAHPVLRLKMDRGRGAPTAPWAPDAGVGGLPEARPGSDKPGTAYRERAGGLPAAWSPCPRPLVADQIRHQLQDSEKDQRGPPPPSAGRLPIGACRLNIPAPGGLTPRGSREQALPAFQPSGGQRPGLTIDGRSYAHRRHRPVAALTTSVPVQSSSRPRPAFPGSGIRAGDRKSGGAGGRAWSSGPRARA